MAGCVYVTSPPAVVAPPLLSVTPKFVSSEITTVQPVHEHWPAGAVSVTVWPALGLAGVAIRLSVKTVEQPPAPAAVTLI